MLKCSANASIHNSFLAKTIRSTFVVAVVVVRICAHSCNQWMSWRLPGNRENIWRFISSHSTIICVMWTIVEEKQPHNHVEYKTNTAIGLEQLLLCLRAYWNFVCFHHNDETMNYLHTKSTDRCYRYRLLLMTPYTTTQIIRFVHLDFGYWMKWIDSA